MEVITKVTKEDALIGERIRYKRLACGLNTEQVGDYLNITHQQVNKYEKGINRISAMTLYKLAKLFNVRLDYFFTNLAPKEIKALELHNKLSTFNNCDSFLDLSKAFMRINHSTEYEMLIKIRKRTKKSME